MDVSVNNSVGLPGEPPVDMVNVMLKMTVRPLPVPESLFLYMNFPRVCVAYSIDTIFA